MWSLVRCQFGAWGRIFAWSFLISLVIVGTAGAATLPTVRVGALKFGTVNWELDVMARHGIDRAHGFVLKTIDFAGKDGANIALQGGEVDIILTDWLWVARRRAMGGDFTFVPHSHITGGLMVPRHGDIAKLADLKGKKLGIGGGPVDKSWIILRAYAQKTAGFDPAREATPVFAAPPLLNETLTRGGVAAALNFWQYDARLDPAKFVELIPMEKMLPAVGLPADMPLLGWVFSESWAKAHPKALKGWLAASAETRHRLASSDAEWQAIRKLTGAKTEAMLERLRHAYRRGIIADNHAAPATLAAEAQRMINLLVRLGDREQAPPGGKLPPGTFFAGSSS